MAKYNQESLFLLAVLKLLATTIIIKVAEVVVLQDQRNLITRRLSSNPSASILIKWNASKNTVPAKNAVLVGVSVKLWISGWKIKEFSTPFLFWYVLVVIVSKIAPFS